MSLPREDRCFILKLPNEILSETLSHVLPYNGIEFTCPYKKVSDSPFHSVRAVCRQFRCIVAELPFWCLPDFNILKLKPRSIEDVDFLHDLFRDRDIVKTLQRRTDWTGLTIGELEVLVNNVPLFRENTKSIHLQFVDEPPTWPPQSPPQFDIAVATLKTCRNLTSLSLYHVFDYVNLDAITEEFPSLEIFKLQGSIRCIYGTLDLENLREMAFKHEHPDSVPSGVLALLPARPWNLLPNSPNILPINSITIETLSIECLVSGFLNPRSLDTFVNLTSLEIRALDDHVVCHLLMTYPRRLTTFKTATFGYTHKAISTVAQAFSSPCLENVQELEFGFLSPLRDRVGTRRLEPIIDAITKITTIRQLHVSMVLDLHWYIYFRRMTNLKRLLWESWSVKFSNPSFKSLGIDRDEANPSMTRPEKSRIVFSQAFREMPTMPTLIFSIDVGSRDPDYGGIVRLRTGGGDQQELDDKGFYLTFYVPPGVVAESSDDGDEEPESD